MKLDYSDVRSAEEVKERFVLDARSLLLGYHLERGQHRWQITALELYLFHPVLWRDDSTHGKRFESCHQLRSGTWYVHKEGGLPPRRLGIDITAGSPPHIHCGLLIAAIGEWDGSGRAVKSIIRGRPDNGDWDYTSEEMKLLKHGIHGSNVLDGPLRLVPTASPRPDRLFHGPRKGLRASLDNRFRSAFLRIASRNWSSSPGMVPL